MIINWMLNTKYYSILRQFTIKEGKTFKEGLLWMKDIKNPKYLIFNNWGSEYKFLISYLINNKYIQELFFE
jgi:hypothetical protein